jgi:hypothetical protein
MTGTTTQTIKLPNGTKFERRLLTKDQLQARAAKALRTRRKRERAEQAAARLKGGGERPHIRHNGGGPTMARLAKPPAVKEVKTNGAGEPLVARVGEALVYLERARLALAKRFPDPKTALAVLSYVQQDEVYREAFLAEAALRNP